VRGFAATVRGISCLDLVATISNQIGVSSKVERICNAKVFGMHEIELQPGVEPEDYERFFAEELAPTLKLPGWKTHLLRGDRGARAGKYLVLHEVESLDSRDRYFPGPGEQSEEFTRFLEQHPETAAAMEKWERYSTIHSENDITTDYVAVAE